MTLEMIVLTSAFCATSVWLGAVYGWRYAKNKGKLQAADSWSGLAKTWAMGMAVGCVWYFNDPRQLRMFLGFLALWLVSSTISKLVFWAHKWLKKNVIL